MQMEAVKLAFADALHIADPAFLRIPRSSVQRVRQEPCRADHGIEAKVYAHGSPLKGDTVYFCCADGQGNSISMIQSLYQGLPAPA